jgi:2-keto-4-pentenoate hydratase/2-oxohepta-3-ene-1,7-dioic acid hydratase in catechol pathway
VVADRKPDHSLSDITFLPVIPNPGQIFCIGLNYGEHVRETGREVTETPVIFLRLADSQVAHGQDIMRPPESHRLDYEAEIAVIIGKGGRRIQEENAWDHIAG